MNEEMKKRWTSLYPTRYDAEHGRFEMAKEILMQHVRSRGLSSLAISQTAEDAVKLVDALIFELTE